VWLQVRIQALAGVPLAIRALAHLLTGTQANSGGSSVSRLTRRRGHPAIAAAEPAISMFCGLIGIGKGVPVD
jgi:hypothetical protein